MDAIKVKYEIDLGAASDELNQLAGDFNKTETAGKKAFDNIGKEAAGLGVDLGKPAQATEDLRKELEAVGDKPIKSFRSLSQQVKEYQLIAFKAGETSVIGKDAIKRASELKDRMQDLSKTVDNVNPEKTVQGFIQLGSVAAAGFSIAQGASALFGADQKEVEKQLLKVQAAMGVLQGIEAIRAAFEKESALVSLANKAKSIAATYAEAAAVGQATVAQKLFNFVANANPIALIISGLTVAIGVIAAFAFGTSDAKDIQEEYNLALEGAALDLQDIQNAGELANETLRAQGQKTFEQERKTQNEILQNLYKRQDLDSEIIRNKKADSDDQKKAQEDILSTEKGIHAALHQLRLIDIKEDADAAKDKKDLSKKSADDFKKNQKERHDAFISALQDQLSFIKAGLIAATQGSDDELKYKIAAINKQREIALGEENIKAGKIAEINAQANKDILDATKEKSDKEVAFAKTVQQNLIDSRLEGVAKELEIFDIAAEETAVKMRQSGASEEEVLKMIRDGRIKIIEDAAKKESEIKYGKDQQKTQQAFDLATLQLTKQATQGQFNTVKDFEEAKRNLHIQNLQQQIVDAQANGQETIKLQQELADQELAIEREKNDKKAAMNKQVYDLSVQLGEKAVSSIFQYQRERLDRQTQYELSSLDDKLKHRKISEKEYEKQKAEIMTKQAKDAKNQALFEIAIQTAIAIAKAIAQSPETFGLPFSAYALAQGAIEFAIVQARPLPKFAKGKVRVDGPGTGTSDSIHAKISKDESIITAAASRKWQDELEAMNRLDFDSLIYSKYVLPALKAQQKKQSLAENMNSSANLQRMFDDSGIINAVKGNKAVTIKNADEIGKAIAGNLGTASSRRGWN